MGGRLGAKVPVRVRRNRVTAQMHASRSYVTEKHWSQFRWVKCKQQFSMPAMHDSIKQIQMHIVMCVTIRYLECSCC